MVSTLPRAFGLHDLAELSPPDPVPESGSGPGGPEPIHQLVEPCASLFWRVVSFTTLKDVNSPEKFRKRVAARA
jgi:hypothetical protein